MQIFKFLRCICKLSFLFPPNHQSATALNLAPCKGIHHSLGFWIPPCGFLIPSAGFRIPAQWIPDSRKSWIPYIFFCFKLFFAFRFRVRILLYWKTLLEGITTPSLFSFSIYKIRGRNVLEFLKGLWYNNEGDIGGLSTPQHRRRKITNTE